MEPFLAIEVDGSDVKTEICLSVNFNSEKLFEDKTIGRQGISQFLSGESKGY